MERSPLQIGGLIILTQRYMGYPPGTRGVIIHLYRFDPEFCRVRFEPAGAVYPIHRRHFALLEQPARASPADAAGWFDSDLPHTAGSRD